MTLPECSGIRTHSAQSESLEAERELLVRHRPLVALTSPLQIVGIERGAAPPVTTPALAGVLQPRVHRGRWGDRVWAGCSESHGQDCNGVIAVGTFQNGLCHVAYSNTTPVNASGWVAVVVMGGGLGGECGGCSEVVGGRYSGYPSVTLTGGRTSTTPGGRCGECGSRSELIASCARTHDSVIGNARHTRHLSGPNDCGCTW